MLAGHSEIPLTQHFWERSSSVTLTPDDLNALGEEGCRMYLAEIFWGSKDEQICPHCGVKDRHWNRRTRKQWQCKHCFKTFSVLSATPFAYSKIGHLRLAKAILYWINAQEGLAALHLRRNVTLSYKSAWLLFHRLRKALIDTIDPTPLKGVIDMDGSHCCGRPRKKNKHGGKNKYQVPKKWRKKSDAANKEVGKDGGEDGAKESAEEGEPGRSKKKVRRRRCEENVGGVARRFHPNRRILITLREVFPGKKCGAGRSFAFICADEDKANVEALIKKFVAPGSTIRTDESNAYAKVKLMKNGYKHEFVNHKNEYSTDEGVNENQAESFFSRYRRAEFGVYHRMTPEFMDYYANEMIWREELRRADNRFQFETLMKRVSHARRAQHLTNYCRDSCRPDSSLFVPPKAKKSVKGTKARKASTRAQPRPTVH